MKLSLIETDEKWVVSLIQHVFRVGHSEKVELYSRRWAPFPHVLRLPIVFLNSVFRTIPDSVSIYTVRNSLEL
jgi:hypothetical protein